MKIPILNKNKTEGKIRVKTVDGDAVGGDDFVIIDEIIHFD